MRDHWNPRAVSLEPTGDSYQNAARAVMKGYGNYGRDTHARAHRSTKQAGRLGEGERDTEKERRGKEEGECDGSAEGSYLHTLPRRLSRSINYVRGAVTTMIKGNLAKYFLQELLKDETTGLGDRFWK